MAALRGILTGNRGSVSRLGSKASGITSRLNTWQGTITTRLDADGTFTVETDGYHGGRRSVVATGNINK